VSAIRPRRKISSVGSGGLGLTLLLPLLMGGCPEFQNATVDAIAGATNAIVVGNEVPRDAVQSAGVGILSAAIELFFDQFRSESVR
jgi:hypothetical protein